MQELLRPMAPDPQPRLAYRYVDQGQVGSELSRPRLSSVNHGEHNKGPPEFFLLISDRGPPMAIPAIVALVYHSRSRLWVTLLYAQNNRDYSTLTGTSCPML